MGVRDPGGCICMHLNLRIAGVRVRVGAFSLVVILSYYMHVRSLALCASHFALDGMRWGK